MAKIGAEKKKKFHKYSEILEVYSNNKPLNQKLALCSVEEL